MCTASGLTIAASGWGGGGGVGGGGGQRSAANVCGILNQPKGRASWSYRVSDRFALAAWGINGELVALGETLQSPPWSVGACIRFSGGDWRTASNPTVEQRL